MDVVLGSPEVPGVVVYGFTVLCIYILYLGWKRLERHHARVVAVQRHDRKREK